MHDPRAYTAVATEGSIGLGRGYIEGWWSSDDPVAVVQVLIRNMGTLDAARNRVQAVTGPVTDRVRTALPRHTRARNQDDIAAHYDIGNAFFELFLDETMTYSSAVFPSIDASTPPMRPASPTPAATSTTCCCASSASPPTTTCSRSAPGGAASRSVPPAPRGAESRRPPSRPQQLAEATGRVADAGLADRVTLLDRDWRDLEPPPGPGFDRAISIEMIEAVDWRDYDAYFATIERCLAPGGMAAIQAIVLPDDRWERAKNTEDFIRRFVFPNGYLPSVAAIRASVERATDMRVVDVEDFAPHYAETLRLWRERFDARLDDVRALGLDDRFSACGASTSRTAKPASANATAPSSTSSWPADRPRRT